MGERPEAYMRNTDAFTWRMEQDPLLRSTVVCVLILDGAPDWDRLMDRIDRATRLAPGFRHRVVEPPLRLSTPRWVVDPDFDLSWHVRRFEAAPPRTLPMVLEYARKTGMAGFDRDRPLWEYTFIDGLEGGRTGLVMKLHHSLTDGVGGMEIARFLFDLGPEPVDLGAMPPAPAGEQVGTADLAAGAVAHDLDRLVRFGLRRLGSAVDDVTRAVQRPRETVGEVLSTSAAIASVLRPVTETMSPVMTERHFTWRYDVLEFPLDEMLDAAHAADATHNDAFLAGITGGLRMYHERHGASVDDLRVTMPVNIRRSGDPIGGNRITLMRFPVPVGVADPSQRMRGIHRRSEPVKRDRSLPYTQEIAGALNLLPREYIGEMLKHIDFLASNVPGIPVPLYLAGSRVDGFYGFGPTIGAAVNITLMSYCGRCLVGVNMDSGAIRDADVFMDCLRLGFQEVLLVAGGSGRVDLPSRGE